jgi:hypothetical protein
MVKGLPSSKFNQKMMLVRAYFPLFQDKRNASPLSFGIQYPFL